MVRAAAAGVIDYSRADPANRQWRIRHRLLINELQRQETQKLLGHVHQHWCAYLAHGNLTEESFGEVKKSLAGALTDVQYNLFPWTTKKDENPEGNAAEPENSKIDNDTQNLINKFKVWRAAQTTET